MRLDYLLAPWFPDLQLPIEIQGLQQDSRAIKPGFLFLAYPGTSSDGRLFVQAAIDKGAAAVLFEANQLPECFNCQDQLPCFAIPELASQLGAIAARFYDYPAKQLSITGVTGTNGKTTIAYLLAQAQSLLAKKTAYIGTIGQGEVFNLKPSANTTPDAIRLQGLLAGFRQQGLGHLCMEVSSHALDQERVAGLDFQQAIFSNLSHDHLDYHHSLEAYAAAKAKLFAWPGLSAVILNADDPYSAEMAKVVDAAVKPIYYGLESSQAEVRATEILLEPDGSSFTLCSVFGEARLKIPLLGLFNVYNILAVFSSLMLSGFDFEAVISILPRLRAAPGRMELVQQQPAVVVDYAHTPDALEKALKSLRELKPKRLIAVFGCGGDRDREKRPIMGGIAEQWADRIIICSDNPRSESPFVILQEIMAGMQQPEAVQQEADRAKAIVLALQQAAPGDLVLIAGKGHEDYQEINGQRLPFSDQEQVRAYFSGLVQ